MPRVFKAKELKVVIEDKPGTLARVTSPIADARVNIGAFCGYKSGGGKAEFLFITSNNDKAKEVLAKAGIKASEREVVVVESTNEAGVLNHAAQQLAKMNVDLDYCYATAGNQGTTWIIFATSNPEKALNAVP